MPGLRLLISRATEPARLSQCRLVPRSARAVRTLKDAIRTEVVSSIFALAAWAWAWA